MKRAIIKKSLSKHYSKDSIKSILSGRMKPSYEVIIELNQKNKIPFTAWKDIKSYITESVTSSSHKV